MSPDLPANRIFGNFTPNSPDIKDTVPVAAKPDVPVNLGILNEPSNPAGIQNAEDANPGFPAKPGVVMAVQSLVESRILYQ